MHVEIQDTKIYRYKDTKIQIHTIRQAEEARAAEKAAAIEAKKSSKDDEKKKGKEKVKVLSKSLQWRPFGAIETRDETRDERETSLARGDEGRRADRDGV